jgi:arylsulfatase A-like enzyme
LGYEDWNTPNARGFDDYIGFIGGASPYDYNPARKNIMHNDALYEKPFEHTTDLFTEGALHFIEANKERPFFLYLAYNAVHGPLWSEDRPRFSAKQEWLDKYADKGLGNDRLDYVAIIAHMDDGIGKIVNSLEANGIAKDTLIVFMSDNGACLTNGETKGHFPGNNGPFRNGKGSTYNGGITVPMIMYWPGTIPAGGVVEDAVTYVDLFPTILTAAQVPVPERNGAFKPRGTSLLDTAKSGGSRRLPERTYFVELVGKFASRKGPWKLVGTVDSTNGNWTQMVDNIDSKKFELYNLSEDIGELNDLAEAQPQIHEELRERIVDYFKSIAGRS